MHPGDQHKPAAIANPYAKEENRISPYTAVEIATLQAKLDQQLGPEFISSRPGAGGKKVHYIQADKCINLANQVFGFNGWSSSITSMEVDFLDQGKNGNWSIGVSVTVRVTLKDGTFHEDVGYGQMDNGKKAQVFEKAKKEGTTDGLKRALRSFGNLLGNCLYDKDFMAKITRVKAPTAVFDESRLHRHGDEMGDVRHNTGPQVKQENLKQEPTPPSAMSEAPNQRSHTVASPEPFDEYGGDEFEELGIFGADDTVFDDLMPDEATADYTTIETPSKPPRPNSGLGQGANQMNTFNRNNNGQPPQQQRQSPTKQPQRPPTRQYPPPPPISAPLRPQPMPSGPQGQTPRPQSRPTPRLQGQPGPQGPNSRPNQPSGPPRPDSAGPVNAPPKQQPVPQLQSHPSGNHNNTNHNNNNNNPTNPTTTPAQPPQPHNPPIGFYTGRAAMSLKFDTDTIPEQAAAFDPRRPTTIPRSAGIDHSKSSPVPRKTVQGVQAYSPPGFQMPGMNRQIGMPPGRAQFRAPGLSAGTKRPAESHIPQTNGRPALGNTSAPQLNAQSGSGGAGTSGNDVKRARN